MSREKEQEGEIFVVIRKYKTGAEQDETSYLTAQEVPNSKGSGWLVFEVLPVTADLIKKGTWILTILIEKCTTLSVIREILDFYIHSCERSWDIRAG